MIEDFRRRFEQTSNVFSHHLCHVTVGRRDDAENIPEYPDFLTKLRAPWHPNWKYVRDKLTNVSVQLWSPERY